LLELGIQLVGPASCEQLRNHESSIGVSV